MHHQIKCRTNRNGEKIMPLYDYECEACNHVQEITHNIHEKVTEYFCPKCDKVSQMKKIMSSLNFTLSGDCWAKDGYTKKSDKFNHYIG